MRHQSEARRFGSLANQFELIREIDHMFRVGLEITRDLRDELGPSYFRSLEGPKFGSESNNLFGLSADPVRAFLPMAIAVVRAKIT